MVSKEETRKMLEFSKVAHHAVKDKHSAEFNCPKCGGAAHAAKFKHNGHVWANCEGCGASMME